MILCLGTTPAVQRVMVFRKIALDAVNRAVATAEGPAGKSINVARVLKQLGERPFAIGFLGGDRGKFITAALDAAKVENDFVQVPATTRECVTIIDQSAGSHTELVEESSPVQPEYYEKLFEIVRRRLRDCKAMVMSGSITPGGPPDLYFQCTRMAREAGVSPFVDAQGDALLEALKAQPALVKPNRAELASTLGRDLNDEGSVLRAMRDLCERGTQQAVVTAGKEPALAFNGKQFWRITAPEIVALNPIGSGDAFTAALVARLLAGDDLGQACRWGSASGAANAQTLLPADVQRKEVERLVAHVKVERLPGPKHLAQNRRTVHNASGKVL